MNAIFSTSFDTAVVIELNHVYNYIGKFLIDNELVLPPELLELVHRFYILRVKLLSYSSQAIQVMSLLASHHLQD
jgi:hypothetical protein